MRQKKGHPTLSPGELCRGGEVIYPLELVHHTMDVLSSVAWEMGFRIVVVFKKTYIDPQKPEYN